MRNFLLIFLILFCSLLKGQERIQDKIYLQIYHSPDICYRTIGEYWNTDLRNRREIIKYGNSTGLGIIYKVNSFISILTGIQYTSRGFQTENVLIRYGTIDSIEQHEEKYIFSYKYIGFPLVLNISKDINKFTIRSSFGLITNILLNQEDKIILYLEEGTRIFSFNKTPDYNKLILTSRIAVGGGYRVSQSIEIQFEPTFQYDLLMITDNPIKTYLWNLGLNLSITYKL